MRRQLPLAAILTVQAFLLLSNLDLLPVWADERSTLDTAAKSTGAILEFARNDIHPPLYFLLLHAWRALPLPGGDAHKLRAFSALWALAATVLLDWFWARRREPEVRWLTLTLAALSPCMLLYGRMARSYTMQAALVLLLVGLIRSCASRPRGATLAAACLASAALLYTHYVPAIAILAGVIVAGPWLLGTAGTLLIAGATAAAYVPWLFALREALARWGTAPNFSSNYQLTGSPVLEHGLKLAYGAVSLSIGESFLVASLVAVPVFWLLAANGICRASIRPRFLLLTGIAAIAGYVGVSRWVSYPFIPARLLWLLPFAVLAVATGIMRLPKPWMRVAAAGLLMLSHAVSITFYFRGEGFLNPGYSAPLREIASLLDREAGERDLILMDAYNTDAQGLQGYLSGKTPQIVLDLSSLPEARRRAAQALTVWFVRNTRDVSAGGVVTAAEAELCQGRARNALFFHPYPNWQRFAMKLAGARETPVFFYQVTRCAAEMSR